LSFGGQAPDSRSEKGQRGRKMAGFGPLNFEQIW